MVYDRAFWRRLIHVDVGDPIYGIVLGCCCSILDFCVEVL
jgi:hypothetical protein